MKSDREESKASDKLTLYQSLRLYWANVWLVAVAPAVTALAMEYLPPSWPLVFLGLLVLGVFVPYRFGKAPYSYVLACGLIYFFVGGAIAIAVIWLLGIDPGDQSRTSSAAFGRINVARL
jgi:hypothetical protein